MQSRAVDSVLKSQQELAHRLERLRSLRPAALADFLIKAIGPHERRRIVPTPVGTRMYVDPLTLLGRAIVEGRRYEVETEDAIRSSLRTGDVFLDVGANEGYFTALACGLVGPEGFVVAVEPQERLCDLIEINLRLNGAGNYRIFSNAMGGEDNQEGEIHLWPSINSGASSVLARYRFSRATQRFRYISLDTILRQVGKTRVDLVKIDVEGFEGEVIRVLLPHLRTGVVRRVLLDYHEPVLRANGIDPADIHASLVAAGMRSAGGDSPTLRSYVLYLSSEAAE